MTTENVVVLFTDMVGSTALASSLTPDAADEVRRRHFAVLRQAVAEAGGTEVKNLGDGLMVVFATASNALACAVGMQQGIDARTLREWLDARRAAEAREQAERRGTHASPAESLRQALQLIAFARRLHGWPPPDDPRSLDEDQLPYTSWERLRAAWRRNGGGLH